MNTYRHFVSGFFTHRDQAEIALTHLLEKGLPLSRVKIFDPDATSSTHTITTHQPTDSSNEVLKDVLVDSAVGTAVGITLGGLAEVALVAANVTLFVASPLIGPLVMMGWGAGLGGLLGGAIGAAEKPKPFSELLTDSIKSGQIPLVVETYTPEETHAAQEIFRELIGDYKDVASA